MQKYKRHRRLSEFICDNCGKIDTKPDSEIKRNRNLGRKCFCSRSCSVVYGNKNFPKVYLNGRYDISQHAGYTDEFSPFRRTLHACRNRFHEFSITLEDLKEQWELQKGICPYTKILLELPRGHKLINHTFRASLDRIDSSKGYVKGNIQFISTSINLMKATMSDQETKDFLQLIVKNLS